MSRYAIEALFSDLRDNPALVGEFKENPDTVLQDYNLTTSELQLIKAQDVKGLAECRVDPMLLFVSWIAINGFDQVPEYMRRLNTPGQ